MASLKELMNIEFNKVPKCGGRESSSGILNVCKFKNKNYKQGYAWRYMIRRKENTMAFSSSTLIGLVEKCVLKDVPIVIVDEEKARITCESENIDYNKFLDNKMVIL